MCQDKTSSAFFTRISFKSVFYLLSFIFFSFLSNQTASAEENIMEATSSNTANKNVVDVSSLFLFEATGDSESCGKSDPGIAGDHGGSVSLDNDDAESCSWDSADQCPSNVVSMDGGDLIGQECSNGGDDDSDRDDEEEEGTAGVNGRRKSEASADSTTAEFESLTEMEKNKLFWEACLAS